MQSSMNELGKRPSDATASEVKNAWHEYVDRVSRGREVVTVTRYGKPALLLTPIEQEPARKSVFGFLSGSVSIVGDISEPLEDPWEADG